MHGQSLLALAVAHAEMLEFVARHFTWETSAGAMRLVEMPARISFTTDEREFTTYAPLVQAQGGLLVNGTYTHGAAMLRAYDRAQTRLTAREFELARLLEELPAPLGEDAVLAGQIGDAARAVLDPFGVTAEVRAFRPVSQLVLHIPGRAAGDYRQECSGAYPSTRRALSIESRVPLPAMSPCTGTSGNTSATSSRLSRVMTVSAAATMKRSKPAWA